MVIVVENRKSNAQVSSSLDAVMVTVSLSPQSKPLMTIFPDIQDAVKFVLRCSQPDGEKYVQSCLTYETSE